MSEIRISCASLFLWEFDVYDIMQLLLDAGIKSVEFWAETPLFWMNRSDETSLVILEEAIGMMPEGCTLHAPILDLNPASYNDYVHEATIKETLWSFELAERIGARVVTIHAGKRTVQRIPTDDDRQKFRRYLDICCKEADKMDLALGLENSMPGISSMCSKPDEMKQVLDEFGLHFTFDLVHAFIQSPQIAMTFIHELHDRIINVHVGAPHDGKPHYASHRKKNLENVLKALKETGYHGDLTIEIDDKMYPGPLSRDDKVNELRNERIYLESIFEN